MKTFVSAGRMALAAAHSFAEAFGSHRVTAITSALNAASGRVLPVWTVHTPPAAAKVELLPIWTPDASSASALTVASAASSASTSMSYFQYPIAVFESCVVNKMGPPPSHMEGSCSDVRLATRRSGVYFTSFFVNYVV